MGGKTYASKRESLRRLRLRGKINPELVKNSSQTAPLLDTRFGSQRGRVNLPRRNNKGQVVYGPWKPAWRPPRNSLREVRT